MPAPRGRVTAHVTRISQDQEGITTLVLSEPQVLELMGLLNVALREKAAHADGYHLAIRKQLHVEQCQDNPPCGGGEAMVNLVRPRAMSTRRKAAQ